MRIDRIEVGRVFVDKEKRHCVVRITELRIARNHLLHDLQETASVFFEIWDTHEFEEPWSRSSFLSCEVFEARYHYVSDHVLNAQAELDEAQQMLHNISRKAVRATGGQYSADTIKLMDLLVNVARREAALRIAAHEWDQGCAAGCCDDSRGAEKAAELILTEITEEERAELLGIAAQD